MTRGSIRLGRLLGIPVTINPSWFLALAFVVAVLGWQVYPVALPMEPAALHWAMAVVSGVLFFTSVVLHELAHSLVARAYGIRVREITLFVFGGVAQLTGEPDRPRGEFLMAVAGPAASVGLALLFLGVWLATGARDDAAGVVWRWLVVMNAAVGVFNMLPGYPMDGGRVFRSLLWGLTGNHRLATTVASRTGQALALGFMALGVLGLLGAGLLPFRVDQFTGLWLIVLGLFLQGLSRSSLDQLRLLDRLRRYRADQIMTSEVPVVYEHATIRETMEEARLRGGVEHVFVSDGDRFSGLLSVADLLAIPAVNWDLFTARDAMVHAERLEPALAHEDAATLLQRMEARDLWHMPVVQDGRVVGLVARRNLVRLIHRLGGGGA
ncbi:MAG TPA: site-2 protease family protein [Dehalococcoidia bacterium]